MNRATAPQKRGGWVDRLLRQERVVQSYRTNLTWIHLHLVHLSLHRISSYFGGSSNLHQTTTSTGAARHAPPSLFDIPLIPFYRFFAFPPSGHIATAPSSRAPIQTTRGVLQAPQASEWLPGGWPKKLSILAQLPRRNTICCCGLLFMPARCPRSRSSFAGDGCRGCRLIGCRRNPFAAARGPVDKLPQTDESDTSTHRRDWRVVWLMDPSRVGFPFICGRPPSSARLLPSLI